MLTSTIHRYIDFSRDNHFNNIYKGHGNNSSGNHCNIASRKFCLGIWTDVKDQGQKSAYEFRSAKIGKRSKKSEC